MRQATCVGDCHSLPRMEYDYVIGLCKLEVAECLKSLLYAKYMCLVMVFIEVIHIR